MKLITYSIQRGKTNGTDIFFKQGKVISLEDLEKDLTPQQIRKLKRKGEIGARPKVEEVKPKAKVATAGKRTLEIEYIDFPAVTAGDLSILEESRPNYKMSYEVYYGIRRPALLRKNPKGFWNFVTYLNDEEDLDAAIVADAKALKNKVGE